MTAPAPDPALLAQLRAMRPSLNARGIVHLALFGSRARGSARPDSDVDLLVDLAPGRFSLIDLVGAEQAVAAQVALPVSMVARRSLEPRVREAIASETIELF